MNETPSELQPLTPKPQDYFLTYEELKAKRQQLEQENEQLRQAFIDNDKKWQADYDLLLAKYELTNERILEK